MAGHREISMSFKALLTLTAIVASIAGLGLLIAPVGMQHLFGIAIDNATASSGVARLLGAYMVSFAIVFWAIRGISSVEAKVTLAKSVSATFVLGTVVMLMLQLSRAIGPLGWGVVAIYATFMLAFGYFGFGKGASVA
jgi:hypothetical protein